jgi:hypothetical protein
MLLPDLTFAKFGYYPTSLSDGSKKPVKVQCDYCLTTIEKGYGRYLEGQKSSVIKKDCCANCKVKKSHEQIRAKGTMAAISEKRKATNIEKYGCVAPSNNPEIREKIEVKNLEVYGVRHAVQREDVKAKAAASNIERYGVANVFDNPEIQAGIRATIKSKYNRSSPAQIHMSDYAVASLANKDWLYDQHITQQKNLTEIAVLLGLSATSKTVADWCHRHGIEIQKYIVSGPEKDIVKYLEDDLKLVVETSDRKTIAPLELDIYIPTQKLAIEYCGLYWHSEIYKKSNYHKMKLDKCREVGIRLITIFEDEWLEKPEIVKNRLSHILKDSKIPRIAGRDCQVTKGKFKAFVETNHTQGYVNSKVEYALVHQGQVVAMMSFGSPRFNKNYQWELLRFVSSANVMGGASKLLAAFVADHKPQTILSYCDLRWGTGGLYEKLGFVKTGESEPACHYTLNQRRYSRFGLTKKHLVAKGHDASKPASQIIEELGYLKIYDCGHGTYVWNSETSSP